MPVELCFRLRSSGTNDECRDSTVQINAYFVRGSLNETLQINQRAAHEVSDNEAIKGHHK